MMARATGQTVENLKNIPLIYPMLVTKHSLGAEFSGINTNIVMFFEQLNPPNVTLVYETAYDNSIESQYESMDIGYDFPSKIKEKDVNGESYYSRNGGVCIVLVMVGNMNRSAMDRDIYSIIDIFSS